MTLDMEIQDMKRRTAIKERAKGKKEGKAEGKVEGRKERTIEIARDMLADGMEIGKVAKLTKLSEEEVAALA
ncbi:MAG: hypothetical protein J5923_02385 [Acidaminococcaceae bacterium]|nr:hypothetical protein [Acidaminococcaceae bacterium]